MIKEKRILVVGGSYLQLPAIIKAKEMGLKVAVADYNPKSVGVLHADTYYNVSTIDEQGIYRVAKEFRADGIVTLATDMPMRAVAYACEKLGLSGITYDTAIKTTDKGEMIKTLKQYNVAHPWYFIIDDLKELDQIQNQIDYPCISKPLDSSGSRGVVLINNKDELKIAAEYSIKHGRKEGIIIQEYMSGKEVSVEILVIEGNVHILAVTDKITTGAPHFVEMGHSQPSGLNNDELAKIKELACKAVIAVGIKNGPAHVEIMLTNEGPKIIELGARMGGDFIGTHLVPLSTGIDMVKAVISLACGLKPDIYPKFNKGSSVAYFSAALGKIKKIEGLKQAEEVDGVIEINMLKDIGEESTEISNSHDRLGYVISQGASAEEARNICSKVIENIKIHVE